MINETIGIAIFAKAPIGGFTKTRLIPRLGAKGAADLQRQLIERTVGVALASRLGPVSIWCAPNSEYEIFASLAATRSIDLYAQSGDDLGARMLNAFEALTPQHPIVVIGTDCLTLEPRHLTDCADCLRQSADVVFLPTEDGGYALVGSARPLPTLFLNMPWGTDRVMDESRLRARRNGLRISEPALLWDIDTPADYERAMASGLLVRPVKYRD